MEPTKETITEAQARAIYCLRIATHGVIIVKVIGDAQPITDEDWYIARVKPMINNLLATGLLRRRPYDDEMPYELTEKATEAYSQWYAAVGFNKDDQIQRWMY